MSTQVYDKKTHDDILIHFQEEAIRKITERITGEDWRGIMEEKVMWICSTPYVIGETKNCRVLYKAYGHLNNFLDKMIFSPEKITQEIKSYKKLYRKKKNITHRAIILPRKQALKLKSRIAKKGIKVISWDHIKNSDNIEFRYM